MHRFALRLSVIVIMVLGLTTPWNPHVAAQDATPAAGDVEAVARQAIEALSQALATGDTAAIDAVFAETYVDHTPEMALAGGGEAGREELKVSFQNFRAALPDATFTVEDVLVEGDQAAVRIHVGGTLDPTVFGMAGETQPLDVGGVAIFRIADGQVVESWDYDEFAEQLLGLAMAAEMATPMAGTPTTATAAATVAVALNEFTIEMPAELSAGPTTFEITNAGTVEHNFEIEGQGIEEELPENLAPGESGTLEVDLQPGAYEVYCPVGNHADEGMRLELTVTE